MTILDNKNRNESYLQKKADKNTVRVLGTNSNVHLYKVAALHWCPLRESLLYL